MYVMPKPKRIILAALVGVLVYGLLRGDLPLILANAVTLALAGTILVFKLKYK